MKFFSVCSGIESASVAWHSLNFWPIGFSEIEPFPCSVLAHRFPDVPNFGDMTKFEEWPIEPGAVDILVGGTPCQSFSIAGLRGGLEDQRGNLALIYCRILQKYQPRWFVWENVPGVLSSNGGRDFGSILGAMVQLGYGVAYRVLDAQFFGVPQRRRRVFVVGCAGDWRRAAEVLFERGCLSGNYKTSRKKKSSVAALTANGVGTCGADDNQGQAGHLIAHALRGEASTGKIAHCLNAGGMGRQDYETETVVAYRTAGDGAVYEEGDRTAPLTTATDPSATVLKSNIGVRRLTPRECERLQGFPDDWTLVPHRGKPAADGPRYKAIGNSMAVPVMRWIGRRIVEAMQ